MGRPLKIQKSNNGILTDAGYPPFASPTSMDVPTVVYPQPQTTLPFTGVVGGLRGNNVSASYPVVEVQVNIALAAGSSAGVHNGAIIRQKGARKFMVVD